MVINFCVKGRAPLSGVVESLQLLGHQCNLLLVFGYFSTYVAVLLKPSLHLVCFPGDDCDFLLIDTHFAIPLVFHGILLFGHSVPEVFQFLL